MFSLLLVAGAVYAGLSSSKTAVQAVGSAIPFGLWLQDKKHVRNMRLGINTEYAAHRQKKKLDPDGFTIFRFPKDSLPLSMKNIESRTWILTMEEGQLLLMMIARKMAVSNEGEFSRRLQRLVERYGMTYDELLASTEELLPELDIGKLAWLSDNRLHTPDVAVPLLKTFQKNQSQNG